MTTILYFVGINEDDAKMNPPFDTLSEASLHAQDNGLSLFMASAVIDMNTFVSVGQ